MRKLRVGQLVRMRSKINAFSHELNVYKFDKMHRCVLGEFQTNLNKRGIKRQANLLVKQI